MDFLDDLKYLRRKSALFLSRFTKKNACFAPQVLRRVSLSGKTKSRADLVPHQLYGFRIMLSHDFMPLARSKNSKTSV
jgi:hypothetical protein